MKNQFTRLKYLLQKRMLLMTLMEHGEAEDAHISDGIDSFMSTMLKLEKELNCNDQGTCDIQVSAYDEDAHLKLIDSIKGSPHSYKIQRDVLPLDDRLFVLKRQTTVTFKGINTEDAVIDIAYRLANLMCIHQIPLEARFDFYRSDGTLVNIAYTSINEKGLWIDPKLSKADSKEVAPMRFKYILRISESDDSNTETLNQIFRLADELIQPIVKGLKDVQRYSDMQVKERQNVLEHTGSTVLISMILSDYFNKIGINNDKEFVMARAALHDIAEGIIKEDVPYPEKYENGTKSERIRALQDEKEEDALHASLGKLGDQELYHKYLELASPFSKRPIEFEIAKLADILDVLLYARSEIALGNPDASEVEVRAMKRSRVQLDKIVGLVMDGRKAAEIKSKGEPSSTAMRSKNA
jgi:5'-deoxynucleotidase YfbR-like HD superfamily hydrolase